MDANFEIKVYSVVTTARRTRDEIERYLYDHTKIVEAVVNDEHATRDAYMLCTTASGEIDTNFFGDVHERAEYLANYQAMRFESGLISARVIGTKRDAYQQLVDSITI